MELLLRYICTAHEFHRAGPGKEGYAFYTARCVLAGPTRLAVWSELWEDPVQSAVAGVCEGGQAVGRYGSDGRQSGAVDGARGWAIGSLDLLYAEQRREERGAEEMVLDDYPGHRGNIRR